MAERKIIYKAVTGSHLYGTNLPTSDLDYQGVFLPSTEDLLSLQNCQTEWSFDKDGVDEKYYSLPRFLELAAQGQPSQLELLFVPEHQRLVVEPEWLEVLSALQEFKTQSGIKPFIGFALAQSHKSTIKGGNLNVIRGLIEGMEKLPKSVLIKDHFEAAPFVGYLNAELIKVSTNEHGFEILTVAGRSYDVNIKTSTFLYNMKTLEQKYGERSNQAAMLGTDYKSLMHAERLVNQAEEFLKTGFITLPRPEAEDLKLIRQGKHGRMDWHEYLQNRITQIRGIESALPKSPNRKRIGELCQEILLNHLRS